MANKTYKLLPTNLEQCDKDLSEEPEGVYYTTLRDDRCILCRDGICTQKVIQTPEYEMVLHGLLKQ